MFGEQTEFDGTVLENQTERPAPNEYLAREETALADAPTDAETPAASAPGITPDAELTQADESLSRVEEELKKIRQDFESKLMYDRHKDALIDKLHRELQDYKGDLLEKIVRPLLMDMIGVNDQLRNEVKFFKDPDQTHEPRQMLKSMENLLVYLEEILYRQGVETFTSEEGAVFSAGRQKSLRSITTDDETKHKMIAAVHQPGYEYNGKQIRPELVNIYLYKKPESSAETNAHMSSSVSPSGANSRVSPPVAETAENVNINDEKEH
jgi:molecular chaperone GrpE (heat shock protein)